MERNLDYPIIKKDKLNRVVWEKTSSTNEVFRDFWEETSKIKIVYRKYNKDYSISLYDKNSNFIGEFFMNNIEMNIEQNFIIKNKKITFKIDNSLCKIWQEKLSKKL